MFELTPEECRLRSLNFRGQSFRHPMEVFPEFLENITYPRQFAVLDAYFKSESGSALSELLKNHYNEISRESEKVAGLGVERRYHPNSFSEVEKAVLEELRGLNITKGLGLYVSSSDGERVGTKLIIPRGNFERILPIWRFEGCDCLQGWVADEFYADGFNARGYFELEEDRTVCIEEVEGKDSELRYMPDFDKLKFI